MIISRPRTSTVASFVIFLSLTLVVLFMNVLVVIKDPKPAWYTYLVIMLLSPIALFVLYKIFIRYKVITLGNNELGLAYPVLHSTRKFPLDQIDFWAEHHVKTGKNSVYKEFEIKFNDGTRLTIGQKEHTEYDRIIQYLSQKAPKKKRLDA
ncbi:MAG: hypothetical protein JJE09_00335 [Bacteroidia bacterium]|nr:hypothetical protein [Bacteroidia bacterium]